MMTVPGEFAVNSMGAATYTVPIVVPPGTRGMVPSLALSYSSRNGDGFIGLGWTLSGLPQITRCPRTIAQDSTHGGVNYDTNDRFCLDGQRLIKVSGTNYGDDNSEYRTEVDNFTKVIAHTSGSSGPDYFEVHLRNGTIMEFGNTTDSHVLATGTSIARVWAVNKITDTTGNYMTVTYNCMASSGVCTDASRTSNGEVYPLRIDYTGNAGASLSPYNSVKFVYATRPDIVPQYHAGSLIQPSVRLTDIKTYQASNVVFDYQLGYYSGSLTTRSRLISVAQCDGSSNCLPATTFGWQGGTALPAMSATPTSLTTGANFAPGDFNGDGLTDVVIASGSNCGIWQGTNSLTFSASGIVANYAAYAYPSTWTPVSGASPCFATTYQSPTAGVPSDLQGLGYSDLLMLQTSGSISFDEALLNNKSGTLIGSTSTVVGYGTLPLAIADFNGDGRMDGIFGIYSPTLGEQVQFSNGDGTFSATGASYSININNFLQGDFDGDGCMDVLSEGTGPVGSPWTLAYSCSSPVGPLTLTALPPSQVSVGDFNGDGLTDILVTTSTTDTLYLSTGKGFASGITLPAGWGGYGVVVGDWNGDGLDDIAMIALTTSDHYHTLFLSTGTGFTSAAAISNSDTGTQAIVADWNNTGSSGLWLQRGSGDGIYSFAYVPELMTSVSNGIGATTTITYDRINQNGTFYAKGSSGSYPIRDFDGPLYAVKQVNSTNPVGGYFTTTYTYGGAKLELDGRGFQGFTTIAASNSQTGITQTTTYNTAFPYTGLVASQTAVHSGTTLSSVTNTYHDDPTNCGVTAASGTYFVCMTQSVVAKSDLNGAALPTTTAAYSNFDAYGNAQTVTTTIAYGGSTSSTETVSNTYTNDTTHWILGLVTATSVNRVQGSSNLTRSMSFDYTTTGLLKQTIVEPSNCEYKLQTDYTIDGFGNRTAKQVTGSGCSSDGYRTAIATRTSSVVYDSAGEFVTSSTNALNQTEHFGSDVRFGTPTSHTDLNGHQTTWTYDSFGRPATETRPDGTYSEFSFGLCAPGCPGITKTEAEIIPRAPGGAQNGPTQAAYYDALGRVGYKIFTGFSDSVGQWFFYDANGRLSFESRPYSTSFVGTSYTYDDLGRVTRQDFPNSSHATTTYNGLTVSSTDVLGHTASTTLTPEGRDASVTDAASHTTSYTYDAFGNLLRVTDPSSNVITNAYDIRGNKTDSYDPDMGHWTYVSDVLGELKTQTDARGQVTSLSYDVLGRVLARDENDGSTHHYANWLYDTATNGIGLLEKACTSSSNNAACTSPLTNKVFTYDSISRPSTTALTADSSTYTFTTTYNSTNGAIDTVTSPSGLVTKNIYNTYGYLCRVTDNGGSHTCTSTSDSHVLWTLNATDPEQRVLSQTAGNGAFTTTQTFDANTGLLTNVRAGPSDSVAAFDYTYDAGGNLTYRSDNYSGVYEKFCYDNLNRLTNSATAATAPSLCTSTGSGITSKSIGYNAIGNITSKSDVGSYGYPSSGGGPGSRPHAISSITGTVNGVTNPSYSYDANGNMTSGAGRSVSYTVFNMADTITQGATATVFTYDANHERIKQCIGSSCGTSTTYYLNDPASGTMVEKFVAGATTTWHDYLTVGGGIVGERFSVVGGATSWSYAVQDHLGSLAVLTNSSGTVSERLSYDAWGLRRNSNGTDATCGSNSSATTRGYTGHEMMDGICEINANARIYDPTVGRFMTPDSFVQVPFDGQSFNRYSYVENGPLSATDPSGHYNADIKPLQMPQGALDFMSAVHDMGGWSGPYWNARFASGIENSPAGAMGSRIFIGPSGLFNVPDLADFSRVRFSKVSVLEEGHVVSSGPWSPYLSDDWFWGDGVNGANSSCPGCFMIAANGGIPQVTLNRAQHEAEVARQAQWLRNKGLVVTLNVSFIGRNGVPVTVDYVVSQWLPDGFGFTLEPMYAADVKTGTGGLTGNQTQVYPSMGSGSWVTPVGPNAAAAGFTIGEEVYIPIVYGAQLSTTSH